MKYKSRISNSIRNRVVGYCHNRNHRGFITTKSVKEHDCVGKCCRYFEKYDVQYWTDLDAKKIIKKLSKFYVKYIYRFKISKDRFLYLAKKYYGSYIKVPLNEGNLSIDDFLYKIEEDGYYISENSKS